MGLTVILLHYNKALIILVVLSEGATASATATASASPVSLLFDFFTNKASFFSDSSYSLLLLLTTFSSLFYLSRCLFSLDWLLTCNCSNSLGCLNNWLWLRLRLSQQSLTLTC
jgi:putative flippase GtrA